MEVFKINNQLIINKFFAFIALAIGFLAGCQKSDQPISDDGFVDVKIGFGGELSQSLTPLTRSQSSYIENSNVTVLWISNADASMAKTLGTARLPLAKGMMTTLTVNAVDPNVTNGLSLTYDSSTGLSSGPFVTIGGDE